MAEIRINEDLNDVFMANRSPDDLMTEDQKLRGSYYSQLYEARRGELNKYEDEWNYIQKLNECRRDPVGGDPKAPCSFIPLITPCIEGQVASIVEPEIDFVHYSDNPAHQPFMPMLDAASSYCRHKNMFMKHIKDFTRGYDMLGGAWINVSWEMKQGTSKTYPSGFPRLRVPPILSVLVDGRIKDYKDLQYAEYIIEEVGYVSIRWARQAYGNAKAEAILKGMNRQEGEDTSETQDDTRSFMLLQVWTRSNEYNNLQLIEMDSNGFILFESDPKQPYYLNVENEYPFYFARMIPKQGEFYGFGDGKILMPLQETVNSLTDELEIACRYNAQTKIIVDPRAKMDLEQMNSDVSEIALAFSPRENILALPGQGINGTVVNMIEFLLREAQRITRFSDAMTGQPLAASTTATAVASAMNQGSVGIQDKRSDIAAAMEWADMYCLKLCLEKWDSPFWARLSDNASQYVDNEFLRNVPAAVPIKGTTILEMRKQNPSIKAKEIPQWQTLEVGGQTVMTELCFGVFVQMASGMPKGKNDVYNMIIGLLQMAGVDDAGNPKPIISLAKAREQLEKVLGFKLQTEDEIAAGMVATEAAPEMGGGINPLGANDVVQMPQGAGMTPPPENLMGTMAGLPGQDQRGKMA